MQATSAWTVLNTKIRHSQVLTEAECNELATALQELETRQQLDSLDVRWEQDILPLARHSSKTGRYISSSKEGTGGMVIGGGILAWGVYMLVQGLTDRTPFPVAMIFFAFMALVGLGVLISCIFATRGVSVYERKRAAYLQAREALRQQLPAGARLPWKMCPNCLSYHPMSVTSKAELAPRPDAHFPPHLPCGK